ncbi:MAG: indole-3-glycerol phosphate synthase TrpC [Salinivirgaceae bacterium]|nr:indole-3-glycerol phosphate synthase TrpC [Salinivirgaceae bacterium]
MADILETIVAHKRSEVAEFKSIISTDKIHKMAESVIESGENAPKSMREALLGSPSGIIAEFKRKSPSKGWIKESGNASEIPLGYMHNGAAAISILTDYEFFGGKDEFIAEARKSGVSIPILYKNFVVDEYQLFQARLCGASAVLLIAACLTKNECRQLQETAHQLGLEVLLEMHNNRDFEYATQQPDMYGINNRNLGSFVTDVENSFRLAEKLPNGVCKVSESGISKPETAMQLRKAGFRGFLMGEHFMRADNPGLELSKFISMLNA